MLNIYVPYLIQCYCTRSGTEELKLSKLQNLIGFLKKLDLLSEPQQKT